MSNILSFEEAKKRKAQEKIKSIPEKVSSERIALVKESKGADVSFQKEVKGFRFKGIQTPATFVIVDTSKMPEPFPPDSPPPMVA